MKQAIFAKRSRRLGSAALLIVLTGLAIVGGHSAAQEQTYPGKIGIGIGDSRSLFLTDAAKTFRQWRQFGVNEAAPTDAQGWPTTDAWTVIFDYRPTNAWNFPAQPIDDPERYQMDVFGTHLISFNGLADLTAGGLAEVRNIIYDKASNTTTAEVNVRRAEITASNNASGLLILNFRNTRRTPDRMQNTGLTNLRVLRPGVARNVPQILTSPFLTALRPFSVVRYMDLLETNHRIFYGTGDWIDWTDRRKVTDAAQTASGQSFGYAWEYVALIGNLSNRDLWINIPAEASDEYIAELARLLRDRVSPDLNLYLEYSNEVWNFGFGQYVWNKAAARDEVYDNYAAPFTNEPACTQISATSNLNKPDVSASTAGGRTNREEIWARRRHVRRTKEIGDKFREIFGAGAVDRIRPVLSWWAIQPQEYDEMLQWLRAQYGEPNQYLYSIATTAYFGLSNAVFQNQQATVEEILASLEASLSAGDNNRQRFINVARAFNLKAMTYESGSATGDVNAQFIYETNIANRIRAERSGRAGELSRSNLTDHWFGLQNGGGDLFMQFALVSAYSRYGSWGLTDEIANINRNAKYGAVAGLVGTLPLEPPTGLMVTAGNRQVQLSWNPVSGATSYNLRRSELPWGPFIEVGRNLQATGFTDPGLENGRAYFYVVSSVNDSRVTPAAEGTNSNPPLAAMPAKSLSTPTSVSAARFQKIPLAPESIAAAFGVNLATTTEAAASLPLPTMLAGTTVRVRDSLGDEREAPIFFVSPGQVNYLVPAGTMAGTATLTITSGDGAVGIESLAVAPVAPGLFSADASGSGVAAAVVLRVRADGSQQFEPVARFDAAQNKIVAVPIDLGPDLGSASDQLFLLLFGTGLRHRTELGNARAQIGGQAAEVLFAGAQGGFPGVDQINVRLSRDLQGSGAVNVIMTVDGLTTNTVNLSFK